MPSRRRPRISPRAWRILLPAGLGLAALALVAATRRLDSFSSSPYPLVPTVPFRPQLAALSPVGEPALGNVPVEFAFRPGETLSEVLRYLGLGPGEVHALTQALPPDADPRRLRPTDRYTAFFDGEGSELAAFEVILNGLGRARVARNGEDWQGSWIPFRRTVELVSIHGELEAGPLEAAIQGAGGEPILAYRMSDVLQWDLDFNRDLRTGDRFEVLYEAIYLDGRFAGAGEVVALAYKNRGRRLEAYRYGEGRYYDGEGRPMRKMFLRSPIPYSRVTSRFSHRRFHPILKSYRPHYGVDYGAPSGTPVRVTASGVVAFAAWDRGGGRTVKVRHPNGYLTAYLHLSRFARGLRPGRRVEQGEVIGYVGSTGLATAPHLDYRVQHRGRWIDPLSLKSVPAEPIPQQELADFLAWRDLLRDGLAGTGPVDLSTPPVPPGALAAADPVAGLASDTAGR